MNADLFHLQDEIRSMTHRAITKTTDSTIERTARDPRICGSQSSARIRG